MKPLCDPITAIASRPRSSAMRSGYIMGCKVNVLRKLLPCDIPLVVPAIREFWMPERVREANGQR
jgi:hypothetical protein